MDYRKPYRDRQFSKIISIAAKDGSVTSRTELQLMYRDKRGNTCFHTSSIEVTLPKDIVSQQELGAVVLNHFPALEGLIDNVFIHTGRVTARRDGKDVRFTSTIQLILEYNQYRQYKINNLLHE